MEAFRWPRDLELEYGNIGKTLAQHVKFHEELIVTGNFTQSLNIR